MKHVRILTAAGIVGLLVGCATPARIEMMQVETPIAARASFDRSPLRAQVAVKDVTGGKETNPLWMSSVGSAEFEQALERSLRDTGLLAGNRQGSKYVLIAHLLKLDQPFAGASMTVTATVQYSLVDRASGREVFARTYATPYTAAFGEALMGTERLRLANEGAVRVNIRALLDALKVVQVSELTLRAD